MQANSDKSDDQVVDPEARQPYEAPVVQSVKLSDEAAEALT